MLLSELHRLRPSAGAEFAEHAAAVRLDRVFAHEQALGHLLVGKTRGHQTEHLDLPRRQRELVGLRLIEDKRSGRDGDLDL